MEGEGRVGESDLRGGGGDVPREGRVAPAAAIFGNEGGIIDAIDVERVGAVREAL